MRGSLRISRYSQISRLSPNYTSSDISFHDRLHSKAWHCIYHTFPMACCSLYSYDADIIFSRKWTVRFKCPLAFVLSPGITITFYYYSFVSNLSATKNIFQHLLHKARIMSCIIAQMIYNFNFTRFHNSPM